MIVFRDWIIDSGGELIARQHDNLSRSLVVTGDLPEGWDWYLLVSYRDKFDTIKLTPIDGGVGVTLTAAQLAYSGWYAMQLRGVMGDVTRHTNVIQVYIPASLSGDGNWPTIPSEFTQLEARIRDIAAHPPIPGDNGYWQIYDPDTGVYADSKFPLPEGGDGGSAGTDGGYYTPAVDDEGNLTWTASKESMPAVDGANVMGPQGPVGEQGPKGDKGNTGDTGPQGPAGASGATPQRGVDYWTAADQQAIVNDVLAALPAWEGGSY